MFFNRMFYFHSFMISQKWFRTRLHGNLIEPLNSTRQLDYCLMQVVLNRVNSEIKRFILSSSISEQSESCSQIVQPEVRYRIFRKMVYFRVYFEYTTPSALQGPQHLLSFLEGQFLEGLLSMISKVQVSAFFVGVQF